MTKTDRQHYTNAATGRQQQRRTFLNGTNKPRKFTQPLKLTTVEAHAASKSEIHEDSNL